VYFECVWLLYRRFFDCFSVICNKTFYKVYTLFSHTHLTTLSQLLAVGGVTEYVQGEYVQGEYVQREYVQGEYVPGNMSRGKCPGEYVEGEYVRGEYVQRGMAGNEVIAQ